MENITPATQPFLMTREEAPSYWLVDSLWSVLATAETTGGALTVLDQVMPRRSGPPPHVHERLHEYFYLLDGEIRFQLGVEVETATTGVMLSVPPNTLHAFAVVSETARVLNLYTLAASQNKSATWGAGHRATAAPRRRTAAADLRPADRLPHPVSGTQHPTLAHPSRG